jgi:hypothetical protein
MHPLAAFSKYAPKGLRSGRDGFRATNALIGNDAAVAGGQAFLTSELEKIDPKVREPLVSVTWARDMPVNTGGGYVDNTSTFSVDYATSGPNTYGLQGNQTTDIPVAQANLGKDIFKVFNWQNVLKVSFVDLQKSQTAGRSLEDLLDKSVRLNWNKSLDAMTYQGFGGAAGLFNNPLITASAAPNGAAGTATWATKTPLEILADVNSVMVATWAASEYDVSGMANHILVPPADFARLLQPISVAGVAGSISILEYILQNNIGKTQGVELQIHPSRWAIAAGTGGKDRLLAYVNNDDRIYMDIPVVITRQMTQPSVEQASFLTLYGGQIGQVKVLYTQPAAYLDGI